MPRRAPESQVRCRLPAGGKWIRTFGPSAPEAVDIVLINRPELPPAGAGESSIRPVAAALANAVFDATGVRLRRAPLTPQQLKPALA